MAEILPIKNKEEQGTSLFYFSILIFIVSVVAFLVFLFLEKKVQGEIDDLEKTLLKAKPPLEKILKDLEKDINNFEILLQNHIFPSKIFDFVEKKVHPRVFVQRFIFNVEGSTSTVSLEGKTDDFYTLGQQMLILKNENKLFNLVLEGIQIDKDQRVEFNLKFNLKEEIIKPAREDLEKNEIIVPENENI